MSAGTGNLVSTCIDNFRSTGILLSIGTDILLSTDSGTTLLDAGSGTIILGTVSTILDTGYETTLLCEG